MSALKLHSISCQIRISHTKQGMIKAPILQVLINQQWRVALKAATIQPHKVTVLHSRYGFYFSSKLLFPLIRGLRELLHGHHSSITQLTLQESCISLLLCKVFHSSGQGLLMRALEKHQFRGAAVKLGSHWTIPAQPRFEFSRCHPRKNHRENQVPSVL